MGLNVAFRQGKRNLVGSIRDNCDLPKQAFPLKIYRRLSVSYRDRDILETQGKQLCPVRTEIVYLIRPAWVTDHMLYAYTSGFTQ